MKTFKCDFGHGITCEMQTTDYAPEKGKLHIQKMEWGGKPNKSCLRPYIAWVNSVNKTLADEWGVKILHVFQTSEFATESWCYEPGRPPKRVSV